MANVIGQLCEELGEVRGEWEIPNFLSLPEEVDKWYKSPPFFSLDSCWCLQIFPNGRTAWNSEGWVGVYLWRLNCDSPVFVSFSITIRIANVVRRKEIPPCTFKIEAPFLGCSLLRRSDLQGAVSPSVALTVSYTLKSVLRHPSESTLCRRLWETRNRCDQTLSTQNTAYVVLKFNDGEMPAHKAILESSSAVFARMFSVDMRESRTGAVNIEDATRGAFRVALSYIYGGDPRGLSCENVFEVYRVAHKYEFRELREFCAKFMEKTLCADTVCEVIALADLHRETALMESARDFFAQNKTEIFKTEKWNTFKKDNPAIAFQLLESV